MAFHSSGPSVRGRNRFLSHGHIEPHGSESFSPHSSCSPTPRGRSWWKRGTLTGHCPRVSSDMSASVLQTTEILHESLHWPIGQLGGTEAWDPSRRDKARLFRVYLQNEGAPAALTVGCSMQVDVWTCLVTLMPVTH